MIELDDLAGEARRERDQADLLLKRSHEILEAASAQSASEEIANPTEPDENRPDENRAAEPSSEPSPPTAK
jgi:hypothetical protein